MVLVIESATAYLRTIKYSQIRYWNV